MGDNNQASLTRRGLLLAAVTASVGAMAVSGRVEADAAPLPHLDPNDPLAKGLGYTPDAKSVDAKSNPTYKPGSMCANCAQLQGKVGDAYRPCTIFAGHAVNANGWCRVWAKNPKMA